MKKLLQVILPGIIIVICIVFIISQYLIKNDNIEVLKKRIDAPIYELHEIGNIMKQGSSFELPEKEEKKVQEQKVYTDTDLLVELETQIDIIEKILNE